jgi:hypothetical protein
VILSLSLGLAPASSIADEPPRLVGAFGGRTVAGTDIVVLDLSAPAIRRIDRRSLRVRTTPLAPGGARLDPYGIATRDDRSLLVLADKGRNLVRFSALTGEKLETRQLPEPAQGVTTLWNGRAVGVVPIRLRSGEPMLLAVSESGLRPFSSIVSRSQAGAAAHLVANLLRCGSGDGESLPCWFLAGPPEVALVRRDGAVARLAVPSLAVERPERAPSSDPAAGFSYPVRDALVEAGRLWVLTNQEGDRTPLEAGAVRARHIAVVREGRPRSWIPLGREARAILDATEGRLVLLYADGSMGSVAVR